MYRNARKVYATHCVEHLVTGAKHDKLAEAASICNSNKLAVAAGRTRRDATGATELTGAHVTHKRAVHAEHRDTAVQVIRDSNVAGLDYNAKSLRPLQLPVAVSERSEATKKSAVTAAEHADATRNILGDGDDFAVCTHPCGVTKLTRADKAVKV